MAAAWTRQRSGDGAKEQGSLVRCAVDWLSALFTSTAILIPRWASSMTKNDLTTICMVAIGAVAVGFGWGMNIWGGGCERTYERMKRSGNSWVVLRALKIEQTQENCIRFLKIASAIGLFVVIPFVAFSIIHTVTAR
jgi:hypothetical protein